MQVELATLCLLRAAGSMPVFLKGLQDKGERERSWGEGLKRDWLVRRSMYSCFPLHVL